MHVLNLSASVTAPITTRPSLERKSTYRRDIDGLRATAVLSVMAYHFFPGRIKGGFVGVDIFFVISGYLISSIIYDELESGSFSIAEFYVRRIRRIYPALFVVLAAVCVAGWLILLPTDFVHLGKQIVGGSTFVANFVLWSQSGYFSPDAQLTPLLNLWSLGVEEQFYLIFPLICLAFYRGKSSWTLPLAFLALATVSMSLNVALVSQHREATYFLPFSRLWELLVGAGLSLCHRRMPLIFQAQLLPGRWWTGLGLSGLTLIIASMCCIDQHALFPGWWALFPTIGTALVIAAGPSSWCNRHILSSKLAVSIGLISYPLYLWHWPLLCFARIATHSGQDHDIPHILKSAVIVLCFGLAYLTFRYIELPIRQVKRTAQRRVSAMRLLGLVSMTGAFGVLVVVASGFPSRFPSAVVALDHDYGAEASLSYREGTCFLRTDQSGDSFGGGCLDSADPHNQQPLVLVWGDSHAADLVPGFRKLQSQAGVRLAQYTASMCAPIVGLRISTRPSCFSVNNAVLDRIRMLKPKVVILSARWDYLGPDQGFASCAEKLSQTIQLVKAAGVQRVVVIGSAPFWTNTVPSVLIDDLRRHPHKPIPNRLPRKLLKSHDDALLRDTSQKAGAAFVPIFDFLCDDVSCIATTGPNWMDLVTYDSAHFTEHGSILVAQRIWPTILQSLT